MDYFAERNYELAIREGKTTDVIDDVYGLLILSYRIGSIKVR